MTTSIPTAAQLVEAELLVNYQKLAAEGVDLHSHRIATLDAIHDSLNSRRSKYYRSVRGAIAGVVPVVGGVDHTAATGHSHAKKCVEAYGLAGQHGNQAIVKEVVGEILKTMGIKIVAEEVVGAAVPGISIVLAAMSAPKVMEDVLRVVHERANELHMNAIKQVQANL
ncbi:hypothetical protein BGX27_005507 [Mortierella sp. AM989]|nr:hypothetical protein BGX27_005507 [Mortierella sp. AM989]